MQNDQAILGLVAKYDNKEEILEELHKLSKEDEIEVLSQLIGYSSTPVDVETFIKDDYYLGKIYAESLYPIWMERLKIIYPDPIRTSSTFISVSGCIGSGKSTFSLICLAYDYYKFSLIEDPYKFLSLASSTPFTFRFFNVNLEKAGQVFINPLMQIFAQSPYFQELHKKLGRNAHGCRFLAASQPRHVLSEAVISGVISEANFFRAGVATQIIDNMISRLESRMQLGFGFLNHVILDSSDTTEDSAVCDFIKNSAYSTELIQFNTKIWEAKAHMGIYFNSGSFMVYAGDAEIGPFILDRKRDIDLSKLDKDRIIECPNEVRSSFEKNIELALQEKCGISLRSTDNFIIDKETVKSKFDLQMVTDEVIVVDFYDSESIMSVVQDILTVLPLDRKLYCRVDMGVSHDHCGFAIAYFDGMKTLWDPDQLFSTFKVPVCFGISRVRGQETPINKIRDFIIELSKLREIALVTTDQYQSTQLRQELTQAGIKAAMTSVDRTDSAYKTLKNLLMEDRCHICQNTKARWELLNLKRFGKKIDHEADKSKDQMDAIAGAVESVYKAPIEAAEPTTIEKARVFNNLVDQLAIARKNREVGKLNNRNFWR